MSPAPGNRVVVAGAGTGKTHALVMRYLEALLGLEDGPDDGGEGERGPRKPERILAITFTDKAASEMRARIQRRLAALLFAVRTGDASGLDPVEVAHVVRIHEHVQVFAHGACFITDIPIQCRLRPLQILQGGAYGRR